MTSQRRKASSRSVRFAGDLPKRIRDHPYLSVPGGVLRLQDGTRVYAESDIELLDGQDEGLVYFWTDAVDDEGGRYTVEFTFELDELMRTPWEKVDWQGHIDEISYEPPVSGSKGPKSRAKPKAKTSRKTVSGSSKPRIFTVADWDAGRLGEMRPGDELDRELYNGLRYRIAYSADPRFLVSKGCIRGFCQERYSDEGSETYGETFDGRYVYLGLSVALRDTPYQYIINESSLDPGYDARAAAKKIEAKERRQRKRAKDPRSKYVDEDGCRIYGAVGTFDDLVEYYTLFNPGYADRLRDPEVVGYLRDYYAHMDWVNRGNGPSYDEDVDGETMLSYLYDLTEEAESFQTELMEDDYENGDTDMLDFLRRRAAIQRRYGVEPDWDGAVSSSRRARTTSKASKPKAPVKKATPRVASKTSKPKSKAPSKKPAAKPKTKGARRWARPTTPTTPASSCGPSSTSPTRTGTARSSPTSPTTRSI